MIDYRGRILYLEDNEDALAVVRFVLMTQGYEVLAARGMTDALAIAREGGLVLMIVDQKLPDGSGAEFCRKARAFDSVTPMLVYSASVFPADRDLTERAGATAFLAKPAEMNDLIAAVQSLIEPPPSCW